ncbi:MAG: transglutaminase family protein [Candidatus Levybacteria bacterium]|nr:transglutaminase family protein [Candidatus Levybacteria bacterium]
MDRICTRLLFLFLFLFFYFSPNDAFASEYFSTSYYVTYTVQENGNTHANMRVTLTNKTKDYFASSYKIQVGFEHVQNLEAKDPDGPLNPKLEKVEGGSLIEADFSKRVVGEGNQLVYTIQFDTPDVAKKDGEVWEINIPGLSDANEFADFTAEVKVPASFGEPAYIKPQQRTNKTIFTKDQLGKSGISIAYGEKQVYAFNLFYHLKNSNLFPIRTEIALPPSTNYQDVYIEYMNPKPQNVTIDGDGNWLATYRLAPSQRFTVQARGTAVIGLLPKKEPLSKKQLEKYLVQKPYWESANPEIKKLSAELKTPRAIYDYLVKNLEYDFSRVVENKPRLGALGTLRQKNSAVCLEFTDLFIALARAASIPAREVDGFANTENSRQRPLSLVKDILHAWPEYYDLEKQAWVMVDPTWGNTTGGVDYFDVLDFDHMAFVLRGVDSEYPVPAGGYKYEEDENLKDVNVSFPRFFEIPKASISVVTDEKVSHHSLLPVKTTFTVTNTGQGLSPAQKISIASDELTPKLQFEEIAALPPFGHSDVQVEFDPVPILTNKSFPLTITVGGITLAGSIRVTPLLFSVYVIAGGSFIALLTSIIFVVTKKTRRIPVS